MSGKLVSPLAPTELPDLPPVAGVHLAGVPAGIRYKTGRKDLMLAALAEGSTVAGVYTLSRMPSAPVDWCRQAQAEGNGYVRAIVVNSGNSNAFTGQHGVEVVRQTVAAVTAMLDCRAEEVFVASTGVIGEPMRVDKLVAALPQAKRALSDTGWEDAAEAILTTDTFPKRVVRRAKIGGAEVTLCGFAKGSGMIAPHMGTMLAFLFTDATLPAPMLQTLLEAANDRSFNSVTVDGDCSTSDTVLLAATGQAAHPTITRAEDAALDDFRAALNSAMEELAQLIVMDGEGASKLLTIQVKGAEDDAAARRIGLAIGNSPLVKTALAGADPNWGRIVMAVGKSGEKASRDRLRIWIGDVLVAENGAVRPDYVEAPTATYMQGDRITFTVDVGVGEGSSTVWSCDLTKRYIEINADYRS